MISARYMRRAVSTGFRTIALAVAASLVLGASDAAPASAQGLAPDFAGRCSGRLVNLSTRGWVGGGDAAMIAGLIVEGGPATVVMRALGPSLRARGVSDALADPRVELLRDGTSLASLDDGVDGPADWESGMAPAHPHEPALVRRLDPGAYTLIVRGSRPGTALVEAFLSEGPGEIANLSTRGPIREGGPLIGGFIVRGGPTTVALRGLGPTLVGRGVAGSLEDPTIELYRGGRMMARTGSPRFQSQVYSWQDLEAMGLYPEDPREAALLLRLDPGEYSLILRGHGDSGGIALFEAFRIFDNRRWRASLVETASRAVGWALPSSDDRLVLARSAGIQVLDSERLAILFGAQCEARELPLSGPARCYTDLEVFDPSPGVGLAPGAGYRSDEQALRSAIADANRLYLLFERALPSPEDPGYAIQLWLEVWDLGLLVRLGAGQDASAARLARQSLGLFDPGQSLGTDAGLGLDAFGRLYFLQDRLYELSLDDVRPRAAALPFQQDLRLFDVREDRLVVHGDAGLAWFELAPDSPPRFLHDNARAWRVQPAANSLRLTAEAALLANPSYSSCDPPSPWGGDPHCYPISSRLLAWLPSVGDASAPDWLWRAAGSAATSGGSPIPWRSWILWGNAVYEPAGLTRLDQPGPSIAAAYPFHPRGLAETAGPFNVAELGELDLVPAGDAVLGWGRRAWSPDDDQSLHRFELAHCE